MANKAEELLANPTDELRNTAAHLKELSASSQSEARRDFVFDDGSTLCVMSFNGEDTRMEVITVETPEQPPAA